MNRSFFVLALVALLPTQQLVAMESHHTLTPSRSQGPSASQPHHEALVNDCSEPLPGELAASAEKAVVEYGSTASSAKNDPLCRERNKARLEEARQNVLNSTTQAYLFKQQAADLYAEVTAAAQRVFIDPPVGSDIVTQLRAYPERTRQVKTQLAQTVAEINRIRHDITISFSRYNATSQSIQHGLPEKDPEGLAMSLRDIEATMLAAQRDLQAAKEVFELLELKINISAEFMELVGAEERRARKLLAGGKEPKDDQAVAPGIPAADNEKVLSALFFLDTVRSKLIGTQETHPPSVAAVKPAEASATASKPITAVIADTTAASRGDVAKPAQQEKTSTTAENDQIDHFLQSWARAWSEQNLAAYLEHYADAFVPPAGRSRDQWQSERNTRLSKPKFIKVDVIITEVKPGKDGAWRVAIKQRYTSDLHSDHITKVLNLRQVNEGWKIFREESFGAL